MTDTLAPVPVAGRPGHAYDAARLRWATIADAPRLTLLWRLAYPDDEATSADMSAWLEHGGALTLQDSTGRLLAALRWHEQGSGWRIDRVATRPEERGQGYGRWLATKVEALAIRKNVPYLLLDLPKDDPEQEAYYRRMGYRSAADDPGVDGADVVDGLAVGPAERLTLCKVVGGVWQTKASTGAGGQAPAPTASVRAAPPANAEEPRPSAAPRPPAAVRPSTPEETA